MPKPFSDDVLATLKKQRGIKDDLWYWADQEDDSPVSGWFFGTPKGYSYDDAHDTVNGAAYDDEDSVLDDVYLVLGKDLQISAADADQIAAISRRQNKPRPANFPNFRKHADDESKTVVGKLLSTIQEDDIEDRIRNAKLPWYRKASNWSDIDNSCTMSAGKLILALGANFQDSLEVYDSKDLLERPNSGPMSGFLEPTDQYFFLKHKGNVYLINTEGSDYARSALKVTDAEKLNLGGESDSDYDTDDDTDYVVGED